MAGDTTLNKVKTSLRISHSSLDDDISDNIAAAKKEIERAGVPQAIASDDSQPLILKTIKTFCHAAYAKDTAEAERYQAAFESQLENLRKSREYTEVTSNGE